MCVGLTVHLPRCANRGCYNVQELELVHCRLKALDELHLERFAASLRRLCLRQNAISRLNPETFHQLTKLEEVDFYDNKLKDVGDVFDKLSVVTCACSLLTVSASHAADPDGLLGRWIFLSIS